MRTDTLTTDALLTLSQWFSPGFPIGSFSFSHGLEWSVKNGDVVDTTTFSAWVSDVLVHGAGRNDIVLMASAYNAADQQELDDLDALSRALAPSSERMTETVHQGVAFARTASAIWDLSLPEYSHPIAVGAASQAMGIPLAPVATLYLHALAANLTSAAMRLVPLGQTEGHRCLASLSPICQNIAEQAITQSTDDLGASAFVVDIASMKHETMYSRIFRS